jgi:POT family proton-dependent oligopeptide transporter
MTTEANMEKKIESNAGDAKSIAGREEQWRGLRRVPDKLPKIALLILAVEVRPKTPERLRDWELN